QELDEQGARLDIAGHLLAVHRHGDVGHLRNSSMARAARPYWLGGLSCGKSAWVKRQRVKK
ncbi:MAG: hypothetical protein ACRED6_04030, partial [Stellaceae bacterium]